MYALYRINALFDKKVSIYAKEEQAAMKELPRAVQAKLCPFNAMGPLYCLPITNVFFLRRTGSVTKGHWLLAEITTSFLWLANVGHEHLLVMLKMYRDSCLHAISRFMSPSAARRNVHAHCRRCRVFPDSQNSGTGPFRS